MELPSGRAYHARGFASLAEGLRFAPFAKRMRHMHKCRLRHAASRPRMRSYVGDPARLCAAPTMHEQGECMNRTESFRGAGLLLLATTAWGGLFPVAMV